MTAPGWMNAIIGDFGRAAGLGDFALNARGAATLAFETGASLHFEYTGEALAMAVSLAAPDAKALLALAHPRARHGFAVRTGLLAKSGRGIIAINIKERDVTLPRLNDAFGVLWRLAGEIGGAAWA